MKNSILVLFLLVLLFTSSCSNKLSNEVRNCPDAIIDYVHAIKWNDISYNANYESDTSQLQKGNKVGEVGYMLSGDACSGYRMKNGDATLLPKGTEIFEVKGYRSDFRLMAGEHLYEADNNPKATKVADIYDISGRVVKVSFESTIDGSHISDFTLDASKAFIDEYLGLDYVGMEEVYKKKTGDNRTFLRIHLKDGTSLRVVYWVDDNMITPGAFTTERMNHIVNRERAAIKRDEAKSIVQS
ncbi:hypothetical protein ABLT31_34445 [Ammoniphilus sp. 3BR4]